jgi:hypothetical protein
MILWTRGMIRLLVPGLLGWPGVYARTKQLPVDSRCRRCDGQMKVYARIRGDGCQRQQMPLVSVSPLGLHGDRIRVPLLFAGIRSGLVGYTSGGENWQRE